MIKKVYRKYLEIKFLEDFNDIKKIHKNYSVELIDPKDFQLNKFFYKNIGKKYKWIDRLIWTDQNWIEYISNKKVFTYILKDNQEMAGYCEIIFNKEIKETEIAYFGILEEYFGKKLGSYLLSEIIKKSFFLGSLRVWAHTCSLDHENALKNYLARGMKVFKSETLII